MRSRTILGVFSVLCAAALLPADAWAGAAAGELYTRFLHTAFDATVVLNPDSLADPVTCEFPGAACPSQGTVAITISKGRKHSSAIFVSGPVAQFANGCDGIKGASTPLHPTPTLQALTETRFLGRPWIPTSVQAVLLEPFGLAPNPDTPLVLSDINDPLCTFVDGVYNLSFTGKVQFGRPPR